MIDSYIKILSESKKVDGNILSQISHRYTIGNACRELAGAKQYFLNRFTPLC